MRTEFKNGEKIRVYSDSGAFYGEVRGPYGDIKSALIDVYMPNGKIGSFYKKQCRRLVPKKRKELTRKMIAPKPPQESEMEVSGIFLGELNCFKCGVLMPVTNKTSMCAKCLPPAAKPSDKTDEDAAEEYAGKGRAYTFDKAKYAAYLAGCVRARAILGEEIQEWKEKWIATSDLLPVADARIQEIERRERESIADNIRMSDRVQELEALLNSKDAFYHVPLEEARNRLADQEKLLDLAEKALERISGRGLVNTTYIKVAEEALAAIRAGRAK